MKVREAIKAIEADGWYLVTTKGYHRQYKHPVKPGRVTTGATQDEILRNMREAIELHLQGMREDGEAIPLPNSEPAWVDVTVPAPTH